MVSAALRANGPAAHGILGCFLHYMSEANIMYSERSELIKHRSVFLSLV